jgi:hypothetical protein
MRPESSFLLLLLILGIFAHTFGFMTQGKRNGTDSMIESTNKETHRNRTNNRK